MFDQASDLTPSGGPTALEFGVAGLDASSVDLLDVEVSVGAVDDRLDRMRERCRQRVERDALAPGRSSGSSVAPRSMSSAPRRSASSSAAPRPSAAVLASPDEELPFGFGPSMALLERSVRALSKCGVPADGGALVAVRAEIDRLLALVADAEVRFDVHELWSDDGAGSLRGWLAHRGGLGRKAATTEARRIERLESWPEVRSAWSDGVLSGPQVDVLVAAVPRRFVSRFAENAAELVGIIAPLDVEQTAIAMRQWVRVIEAEDGADDLRERPSGLHLDRLLDGQYVLQGHLDATEAAVVDAALRVFDVPDPVDENGDVVGERRSMGRRQIDALVAACSFALAHRDGGGESGRFVPHVSLVIDVQELRWAALQGAGVSTLADVDRLADDKGWSAAERAWFSRALGTHGDGVTVDGLLLDAAAISALSCDSVVQRVMTSGSKVLQLGRAERTAMPWQRRAIIARDRHCRAPGCRTKPRFCEVHHIDHWLDGGRTDVDRMVLLCGTHHREFHKRQYTMELREDGTFTVSSDQGWTRSTVPERLEAPVFEKPVR